MSARLAIAGLLAAFAVMPATAAGGAGGAVNGCGDPIEAGYIACPDLTVGRLATTISTDGRYVLIKALVENRGRASSTAATVQAVMTRSRSVTRTVRPMKIRDRVGIGFALRIADSVRGRRVRILVRVDPKDVIDEDIETNNASGALFSIPAAPPDFVIVSRTASVVDRHHIRVAFTVKNQGLGAAAATSASVYGGGEKAAPAVPALGSGATSDLVATLPIREETRGKAVVYTIVVDPAGAVPEANEANNVSRTRLPIPELLADLVAERASARLSDTRRAAFVDVTVINRGEHAAPVTVARVTADGWGTHTIRVPALDPGAWRRVEVQLQVPAAARGTRATFAVEADAARAVSELDEKNNTTTAALDVPKLLPNLTIVSLAPRIPGNGDRAILKVVVRNDGDAAAPAAVVRGSAAGWRDATRQTPTLRPGARATVELDLAVPARARGHTSRFKVVVDPGNRIDERNESDNGARTKLRIPALVDHRPDLALGTQSSALSGHRLTLAVRIRNAGNAAAPATVVQATRRSGARVETRVPPLAPGGQTSVKLELPVGERDGGHTLTLRVTVDPAGDVREHDEANNSRTVHVRVPAGRPDLAVAFRRVRLSADKSRAVVSLAVFNRGPGRALATAVRLSSSGWRDQTAAVRPLARGARATIELVLPLRDSLRGREHLLVAVVDPERRIAEVDEGDNEVSRRFLIAAVTPDLTVTPVGEPTVEEDLVLTRFRVRNVGAGAAPATRLEVRGADLESQLARVPRLAAGARIALSVPLGISEEAKGSTVRLTAIVDPDNAVLESSEDNNRTRPLAVQIPGGGGDWSVEIKIGLGLLGSFVLAFGGRHGMRVRRRRGWESDADHGDEPNECRRPGEWSRKIELEPKRWIRRQVAHIDLASTNGRRRDLEVEGELVDALNAAIGRYRRRRDGDALKHAMEPVARGLLVEIERWLQEDAEEHEVEIGCHLEGGKLATKFERYKCVEGKPKKIDEWEHEFEDESDEDVAVVLFPYGSLPEFSRQLALVTGELTAFCAARVDLPPATAPETAAVPE
jgi:subtilase family serine protease